MKNLFTQQLCLLTLTFFIGAITCFAQKADSDNPLNLNSSTKYIAIGSSLSAGVRDGGVYRESQLVAFPNLLAQQIGIKTFKLPLFNDIGTGYQRVSVKNGVLKFTPVTGILLDESKTEIKLPKVVNEVDNLAIPYLKVRTLTLPSNEKGAFSPSFEKKSYAHLNRLLALQDEGQTSYKQLIEKQVKQADFFTIELGIADFISYYKAGGYGESISFMTQSREGADPETILISNLIAKGAKGVISNVPNVLKFPFFSYYSYQNLTKKVGKTVYVEVYERNSVRIADPRDLFLPSEGVDGLMDKATDAARGLNYGTPLYDNEVIGYEEQTNVEEYNKLIQQLARQNNLPVVDLFTLYNTILSGNYITEDGTKIDPTFPGGNFFSADGISPTALGQKVITNEFIKVINTFYSLKIPTVSTKN